MLTPGILRFGYAGGGPYLYIFKIHGGGQLSAIPRAYKSSGESRPGLIFSF
jgi:hypothetical protein